MVIWSNYSCEQLWRVNSLLIDYIYLHKNISTVWRIQLPIFSGMTNS